MRCTSLSIVLARLSRRSRCNTYRLLYVFAFPCNHRFHLMSSVHVLSPTTNSRCSSPEAFLKQTSASHAPGMGERTTTSRANNLAAGLLLTHEMFNFGLGMRCP